MQDINSLNSSEEIAVPKIVRFDTPDQQFVAPLREFFSNFGCEVYFSAGNGVGLLYHVVVGDPVFVKEFLSMHLPVSRRLMIVWDVYQGGADDLRSTDWKIVFVDPLPLSPARVQEILKFLFTSDAALLDLRHHPASPPVVRHSRTEEVRPHPVVQLGGSDGGRTHSVAPISISSKAGPPPARSPNHQVDELRISETIAAIFAHDEVSHATKFRRQISAFAFFVKTWLFCFLLIITPLLWYSGLVGLSLVTLAVRANNLLASRPPSQSLERISHKSIEQAGHTLSLIALPFVWLDYQPPVRSQERLLQTLTTGSSALSTAESLALVAREFASIFLPGADAKAFPLTSVQRLQILLTLLTTQLDLISADLTELLRVHALPFNFRPVYRLADEYHTRLIAHRKELTNLDRLLVLYPALTGFKSETTFLVLLQNSLELRPGGGFIGSLGIAKFQEGTLLDFQILDVYQVDGQLKGHVDPPAPIADLLKQEHWYLRDSNWDPDFRINARQAAWFYEKETGQTVDGVIAIGVPFIVDLLKATGPLTIPDYSERITADNFFGKSLFYTQADFFPGSTQKKDFLGAVSSSLISKLVAVDGVSPLLVYKAYEQALASRDIQWFLVDPALQSLIELFGWAGEYPPVSNCPPVAVTASCIPLFAGWVEANVSVNKANYFLKRNVLRELAIDGVGRIREKHTLTYENTSPQDGGSGGGPYRAYLRFYSMTPVDRVNFLINNQKVHPKSQDASVPYFEPVTAMAGLNGSAIVFDVDPGETLTVEANYLHEKKLIFAEGKTYLYTYQAKQPGMVNSQNLLTISYPANWDLDELGGSSHFELAMPGLLRYNMPTVQDYSALLEFRPRQ